LLHLGKLFELVAGLVVLVEDIHRGNTSCLAIVVIVIALPALLLATRELASKRLRNLKLKVVINH
jgi:hypothetical protein